MATYLRNSIPDMDVEVLDGELLRTSEIINRLKPGGIVGIETKTPNYASAIAVAEAAKKCGAHVVLGGVYASALPDRILKHRQGTVDQVVVGFGELPLKEIVKGTRTEPIITNLVPAFNDLPTADRSFVDMESYVANFSDQHPSWNARGTNIFTHMGCKYQCLFCVRMKPGKGIYFRDPDSVWGEIRGLVEEYGIDYVVDFSDTITQGRAFLSRLADAKPDDLNPRLHIFSTADGIDDRTIPDLLRLGVAHVFVGVETGDTELARRTLKGRSYEPEIPLRAIETLSSVGIEVTPSFVLGLPGESAETLSRTYDFAASLRNVSDFEEIFACELIPFPGSLAFSQLEEKLTAEGQSWDTDMFDPEDLKREWTSRFCDASQDELRTCVDDILALGKYKITIRGDAARNKPHSKTK